MSAKTLYLVVAGCSVLLIAAPPPTRAVTLDENCVINILNRTVQVSPQGSWSMPNVPSNMGKVRARATCTQGTQTISGQTDYFEVIRDGVATVGAMQFENNEAVPVSLAYTENGTITLTTIGATHQLGVSARYPDGSSREVTASGNGTNYSSTNPSIASVDAEGVVTAHSSGRVLITARKDEVIALKQVSVNAAGDRDGDGLPDDYETANGLDPNDPIDAQEDQDGDGLTALNEFEIGTNARNADSDGDGITDGEEVAAGADGFITNPLSADTDGDGLNDRLEVLAGSSPTDANDHNLDGVLDRLDVTPPNVQLTFNTINTEVSARIVVTGVLVDGSTIDLTSKRTGTTYTSSNLNVASFGLTDGEIFGGISGTANVTIANSGKQFVVAVTVDSFQPVALASISIPGYANNVDISGNYAYVAAGAAGLQVVDVSDRAHPALAASLDTAGTAIDVRVFGNRAYVADGAAGLQIIDVSNPLAPALLATADTGGIAQDLKVDGQFVYIADGTNGVEIFDIRDPSHPVQSGHVGGIGEARGIDAEGARAVVVAGSEIYVLDIANRAAPVAVGVLSIGPVKDVVLNGNYAYVAAFTNGYRVVRVADPSNLSIAGGDASFGPRDVEITDGFAFFAEQIFPNVIALVNARDPERPVFQSTIDLSSLGDYAGTGIALDGNYAYVTEEQTLVTGDFNATGDTRLFIAQYRRTSDSGGVPPQVVVNAPLATNAVVEGSSVIVDVGATDDIGVKDVTITVDDAPPFRDTARPYQLPITIPFGRSTITIAATATDFGGNTATANVTVPVLVDTDRDGLSNESEIALHHTNPNDADSDDDGLNDGQEIALGTNPLAVDTDGDGRNDADEVSAGTDPRNPDVTPPTVVATDPAAGATGVAENKAVIVTFSEALLARSINGNSIRVLRGDTPAPGSVTLMPNGIDLKFSPTGLLEDNTTYNVVVAGVRDLAGNPLSAAFQFSYVTGNTIDVTPPEVVASNPADTATGIGTNVVIAVVMNEDMDPLSITPSSFFLRDGGGANVPAFVSLAADARTLLLVPNRPLAVGRLHTVQLTGVKDVFQNPRSRTLTFTTGFTPDATPPQILATSLADGQVAPRNAVISVRFNEPISRVALNGIVLKQGASVVSAARTIVADDFGTVVRLAPATTLAASTPYTFAIAGVEDLSGNVLTPRNVNFTTSATSDTAQAVILGRTPPASATNVPLNSRIELKFNERVDPVTVTPSSVTFVLVLPSGGGASRVVPGTTSVSADGATLRFTPARPLDANSTYQYSSSSLAHDQAGLAFQGQTQFTTGTSNDTTPPVVQLQSIADGASGIAVNGKLSLAFDSPLSAVCFANASAQFTSGGTTIQASLSLNAAGTAITLTPQSLLAANTTYTVNLQGLCDIAGNAFAPFTSTFTTSTSAAADTTAPTSTMSPAPNASNVPVTTPVVLTFSELMDATTLAGGIRVSNNGVGELAGTLTVSNTTVTVVTFVPLQPFPGGKLINVDVNGPRDLAGNAITGSLRTFTTGTAGDVTPPQVVSMTPNDGLVDVSPASFVVLTFSESLNPSTVVAGNFALFANGARVTGMAPAISGDNRTVILVATLPPSSVVSVIATRDVRDMSGNALADFVGAFTTATATDTVRPTVVAQLPANGLGTPVPNAESITLYTSEPMSPGTLPGAVHIAQNGANVPGSVTISGDGQAINFRPTQPFARGVLIEVFVDNTALDSSGNAITAYSGSFSILDPATTPPASIGTSFQAAAVPVNAVLEVLFSEPLDPATVSAANVRLLRGATPIASSLSLRAGNRILRVGPTSQLVPGTAYSVELQTGLRDTNGQALATLMSLAFNTNSVSVGDTVAPRVLALSPPTSSGGIGINAQVHARFDETVNPLSVALSLEQATFGSVFWSDSNRELRFARQEPYAANSSVTESLASTEDVAGNALSSPNGTTFATSARADLTPPTLASANPSDGFKNVAVNAVARVQLSEQLDPASVNSASVVLTKTENGTVVPSNATLEMDGRTITVVPTTAYAAGRAFTIRLTGVRDLAGNPSASISTAFETAFAPDTTPPALRAATVPDGLAGVPINVLLQVAFDEPVDSLKLAGITLRRNGETVPVTLSAGADRRVITIKLVQPLIAGANYVLGLTGVQDLSGNGLADRTLAFIAGTSADLTTPSFVAANPVSGTTGVPTNTVIEMQFSKRMSAVSATPETMTLQNDVTKQFLTGTVSLSADGTSIRFQPAQPLAANTKFNVVVANLADLLGNLIGQTTNFTTGAGSDDVAPQVLLQSIADGASGVPVNGRIAIRLDGPVASRCVNGQTVQLSSNGTTVAGVITLSSDRTLLTFTAQPPLVANTAYTFRLQGLCDLAGNVLPNFTTGFTTSSSSANDTTAPAVTAMTPAANATNVPVNTAPTFTFSEAIDVTSLAGSIQITVAGVSGEVAGVLSVSGNTVTFTPLAPLPGSKTITMSANGVKDLAGNASTSVTRSFTTGTAADSVAPHVISMTPGDGSIDVMPGAQIMLMFSESLDPTTLTNANFGMFVNGALVVPTVTKSTDNRTVFLAATLPAASVVSVIVTSDVRDLSGNRLADFVSAFTTAVVADATRPSVASMFPNNGLFGVRRNASITLYASEPLVPATVQQALHVTQNGMIVPGAITVTGSGQVLRFRPDQSFAANALIEVFLDSTALDPQGNAMTSFKGSFQTTAGTAAAVPSVKTFASATLVGLPINVTLDVLFSEPIDPSTVSAAKFLLRDEFTTAFPVTANLIMGGRVARVQPVNPLPASRKFTLSLQPGIRDLDGQSVEAVSSPQFTTSAVTVVDTDPPHVIRASPPDGAAGVGLNAQVHWRFDEPVNPISLEPDAQDGISLVWGDSNRDLRVLREDPYTANSQVTESVPAAQDFAGNSVAAPFSTTFTTGNAADLTGPALLDSSPASSATNVPVNSVVQGRFDEQLDPVSVTNASASIRDGGTILPANAALGADGRTVSVVPSGPLPNVRSLTFRTDNLRDLAGNLVSTTRTFTTNAATDTQPPSVTTISVSDGQTGVLTNAPLVVAFDEPINPLKLAGVTLQSNGQGIAVSFNLSADRRTLTFKLVQPLLANTVYVLSVSGVEDLAGNVLSANRVISFITGAGADL